MDLVGLITTGLVGALRYNVTLLDDASGAEWAHFLRTYSEIPRGLKTPIESAETKTQKKVGGVMFSFRRAPRQRWASTFRSVDCRR